MFDIDVFIDECINAGEEAEPRIAIKQLLEGAMADTNAVAAALPPERAEIAPLHVSPTLTILKVVWTPGMSFRPHNHRMWAAIGIYTGGEDNEFFRRTDDWLTPSGGKQLRRGDTVLLGDEVIHAVTNPTREHAGAIHIYGGDLLAAERSEWDTDRRVEQQYDVPAAMAYFEEQNRLSASATDAG